VAYFKAVWRDLWKFNQPADVQCLFSGRLQSDFLVDYLTTLSAIFGIGHEPFPSDQLTLIKK
jgi:hypothetical protein